ncbi:hypothetical protein ACI8AC_11945 [Geodermatophilus sp. SYSU D00758]
MATSLLGLGAIVGGVVGAVALLGWLARWFCGLTRFPIHRRARPTVPVHRPLERVAADLRRLDRQLSTVPAGAPMARRRGLQAAYDDVLTEAAQLLEVEHALADLPPGMARDVERLRVQAALTDAGLVVRG